MPLYRHNGVIHSLDIPAFVKQLQSNRTVSIKSGRLSIIPGLVKGTIEHRLVKTFRDEIITYLKSLKVVKVKVVKVEPVEVEENPFKDIEFRKAYFKEYFNIEPDWKLPSNNRIDTKAPWLHLYSADLTVEDKLRLERLFDSDRIETKRFLFARAIG